MIGDEWERIAVNLAQSHPASILRAIRTAYYHGAVTLLHRQLAACRANDPEAFNALTIEVTSFLLESGEFE